MRIDLHTHSRISDGTESPAEVMKSAHAAALDVVALTDHDTTAGWAEAAAAATALGLSFVPGMEVSCRTDNGISVHLLSYLHDPADPGLLEEITKARDARLSRAETMVNLLAEDYPLSWDDVTAHVSPGATVGRPHIADALVAAGIVADRSEAFASILTPHSKYYAHHYAPHPARAVELVRAAGGVPVFAHPVAAARGRVVEESVFLEMIDAGLAGVEIDHRDNPEDGREFLRQLAVKHSLLITGSSDYHGSGKVNRLGENLTSEEALGEIEAQGRGAAVVRP
ncbi:PHP domain-containing protein [Pseudarthrobacter sp. J1738]|uniref:PHP domain-containing protein n=1 Tax=unclassified Pseudarthrobacter TaxID=2647000 RepID=UPI003D2988B7